MNGRLHKVREVWDEALQVGKEDTTTGRDVR